MSGLEVGNKRRREQSGVENLAAKRLHLQQPGEEIDLTLDSPRFTGVQNAAAAARAVHQAAAPFLPSAPKLGGEASLLLRPQQQRRARPAARPPTSSSEVVILEERSPPGEHRQRGRAAVLRGAEQAVTASTRRQPQAEAMATALAVDDEAHASEDADAVLVKRLQEEEDRNLAAEQDRIQRRLEELEVQEATAGPIAGLGPGLGGLGWPFGRRRAPPASTLAAGGPGPAVRSRGQRSGGRRSRWQNLGAPHFAGGSLADVLGGGAAHHGFGGQGPPSNLLALQQAVVGAQRSNLPPQLLFSDRDFGEQDYEMLLRLDEGVVNRKGASQAMIDSIETVRLPREAEAATGPADAAHYDDCAVCLEAAKSGNVLRKLPCGHCYHKACIDRWLTTKAACPVCQQPIG